MKKLNKDTLSLIEPVSADSGREYISYEQSGSKRVVPKNKDEKSKSTPKKECAGSLINYPNINSSNPQERKDAIWL